MPANTDLTWTQLNLALGDTAKISVVGGVVVIDPGLVNGEEITTMGDFGVIEFLSKLLEAAYRAQTTANEGKLAGERLNAFPAPTYSNLAGGYVQVTQSLLARVSINPATQSTIVGPVV